MDIFEKARSLKLPPEKYVVIGGGALEGYGIRKSNDVDMCVTKDVYDQLKGGDWKEVTTPDGLKVLHKDNFEVGTKWGYRKYNVSVNTLIASSKVVNGVRLACLQEIINYKKVVNRKKDKKDIKLIEQYLQSHI